MTSHRFSVNVLAVAVFVFLPVFASASFSISEIMYDLPGTDTDREWVEVKNDGSESLDLSLWKFFEDGTNHGLVIYQGSALIPAGAFAIIADKPELFLADHPGFPGVIFDSSFSLSNTGEAITLKDVSGNLIDSASYLSDWGAQGDGSSLQKTNNGWGAGSPTPGGVNSTASSQNSSAGNSSSSSSSANQNQNNSAQTGSQSAELPKITVDAGADITAIVGADTIFYGKAFGIKNEPLQNARFLWNLGDGSSKEGQKIKHSYKHPGEYIVVLNVSSNELSATDRIAVTVFPANFAISRIEFGEDGFIEIENKDAFSADLSGWFLNANGKFFLLPLGTIIDASKKRIFPAEATGLILIDASRPALLYPNGTISAEFEKTVPPAPAGPGVALPKTPTASGNDFVASAVSVKTAPATIQSVSDGNNNNNTGEETGVADLIAAAVAPNSSDSGNIFKWLFFLSALIILTLAVYLSAFSMKADNSVRPESEEEIEEGAIKTEAEKYKIVEENDE